uniref:MAM domain-containing protein n=2 Tax=Ciona intestinalis TaxID=7719 RepID=H2Y1P3_CIOIN
MCGWRNALKYENVDDFNWKRGYGSNGKQKGSGTNDDHGGGGGYMYIKSKNRMNRTAKFLSRSLTTTSFTCFKFWYFMKGRNMGHAAVYLAKDRLHLDNSNNPLWNLRGHQGNAWRQAKVPLPPQKNSIIVIEAFDWKVGRSGNILLDDVSLNQVTGTNECQVQPSYAAPKP